MTLPTDEGTVAPVEQRQATYFDGITSRKRQVTLHFGTGLDLVEDGTVIATWPYELAPPGRRPADSAAPALSRGLAARTSRHRGRGGDRGGGRALAVARCRPQRTRVHRAHRVLVAGRGLLDRCDGGLRHSLCRRPTRAVGAAGARAADWRGGRRQRPLYFRTERSAIRARGRRYSPSWSTNCGSRAVSTCRWTRRCCRTRSERFRAAGRQGLPDGRAPANAPEIPTRSPACSRTNSATCSTATVMRRLIQTGGTSFLIGLLFGDVFGASAVIFATRTLLDASYSRESEQQADAFTAR